MMSEEEIWASITGLKPMKLRIASFCNLFCQKVKVNTCRTPAALKALMLGELGYKEGLARRVFEHWFVEWPDA